MTTYCINCGHPNTHPSTQKDVLCAKCKKNVAGITSLPIIAVPKLAEGTLYERFAELRAQKLNQSGYQTVKTPEVQPLTDEEIGIVDHSDHWSGTIQDIMNAPDSLMASVAKKRPKGKANKKKLMEQIQQESAGRIVQDI